MNTVLAMLLLVPAAVAQAAGEPPLVLDDSRIALLGLPDAAAGVEAVNASLAGMGLAVELLRELPLADAVLVSVPAGTGAEALVRRLAAVPGGPLAAPVFLGANGAPLIPTSRILLRFDAGVDGASQAAVIEGLAAAAGSQVLAGPGWAGLPDAWKLSLPTRNGFEVLELAQALAARDDVRFATPDFLATGRSSGAPNDPLFADSWALHNAGQSGGTADEDMDVLEALEVETGSADVLVLVIDVGVEQDHPDIGQVAGEDFVFEGSGGDAFNACDHHGTAVAGCISGLLGNGLGTTGVAPGCRIASARAMATDTFWCDGSWWTFFSSTPEALAWGATLGARVSNNSNYYGFTDLATEDAYASTLAGGMLHFAAAGNFASPSLTYPASLATILSVSATDRFGGLASFSNWGTGLDLSAPGVEVMTTDRTGADGYYAEDYGPVSGTSFSSPFSAAVAALVISRNPTLSATEVRDIVLGSAVDHGPAGYDDQFGSGVVNAEAALLATPLVWTDLGSGLPGVAGIPLLQGTGTLMAGSSGALTLAGAAPSTLALLFTSLSATPSSFKCGTLVPLPVLILLPIFTDPSGGVTLPWAAWPSGLAGLDIHFQFAVQDAAAPCGVALSNCVRGSVPATSG